MALKVLVADDSAPAKNQGKKILEDAGYEVVACSNGLEAQRKMAESVPDLAILDIFMPGYTGIELCARLRGDAATASLPVILTVGKLEPYRSEEGDQVRANGVVIKPFAEEELLSAVRNLIGAPSESGGRKSSASIAGGAIARSKPLLEWWDPAAQAIERSIAAAQLRRGASPAASTPTALTASKEPSAGAAQDAPADSGQEGDLEAGNEDCEAIAEQAGYRDEPQAAADAQAESGIACDTVEALNAQQEANRIVGLAAEGVASAMPSATLSRKCCDAVDDAEDFTGRAAEPPTAEDDAHVEALESCESNPENEFAIAVELPEAPRAEVRFEAECAPQAEALSPSSAAVDGVVAADAECVRQTVESIFERFRSRMVDAVLHDLARRN